MHQFVQSAIDAANQGDKTKAMNFLKEVISANPKDVDAWLVLAAILDEPERKRHCLNRVLSLDPTNKLAREELLEMDRSAMGATPPFTSEPEPVPVSKPKSQPKSAPSNIPATQPTPTQANHVSLKEWKEDYPKAKRATKLPAEKPIVYKYSTITRVGTYAIGVLFGCSFLLAFQDVSYLRIPCTSFFLILPAVWIVSKQVEVSEKGIRVTQLFGLLGSEIGWNEIAQLKSNAMQRNLELVRKKGGSLKVTTQVNGYPAIVETLRQKRPDLFGLAQPQPSSSWGNGSAAENGSSPSLGNDIPNTSPTFSGIRTFKKSFIKQYGLFLIVLPLGLLAVLAALTESQYRLGASITAVVCFLMMLLPFFQVSLVKVEPNKLTVESFLEQKEFSAKEIHEIKMQSVRGRYGVTNYVNIVTEKKKNYPLQGFKDGDEIIYGILHQWWEAYRNR